MCCSLYGVAQSDVTELINDPDFENGGYTEWKTSSFGRQSNNDFPLKHSGHYREVWSSSGTAKDAYIYQDLTNLPVGTYTLTIACQNIKQSNKSQVCTGAWIYANEEKKEFDKPAHYSVTTIVTDGNLRIGAEVKACTGNYVCIDNCRLSYQLVLEDVKDYFVSLLAEVDQLDQHDNTRQHKELMEARDEVKQLFEKHQVEGLIEAVDQLHKAMLNYRYSLTTPSNPMEMTEMIQNPGFENGGKGWTFIDMGTQGNNDFPGKKGNTYAEKWTSKGGKVADCCLKQTISQMPCGRYRLTASAWNVQQSNTSTKQKGCFLWMENQQTEISTLGTYSVEGVCLAGELTIGFKCEGATGNYCCVDNFQLYYLGSDTEAEVQALQQLIAQANNLLMEQINTNDKEALQKAIEMANAAGDEDERGKASTALSTAIDRAEQSMTCYKELDLIIKKGQDALQAGKPNGTERLEEAIRNAEEMKNSGHVDADGVTSASTLMDDAIFAYNVLNGSGTAPKVTTFPTVIVGCNAFVGRLTATGSNIIERGFCWAENPNPTVLDEHSSNSQTNAETGNKPVYVMYGVKPSTEYWVRAYAINKNWAVGYGDPVRVITLPQGETVYTFLWNGDEEHNLWLDNAMREATAYYNTWTAIKGFRPTANYSPGTETADCSYGGWINVGPWRCNTGTMVHEMMHGTGVGQHGRWWDKNLHFQDGDNDVVWRGERANRVTNFFEPGYVCNGDGIHVCYEGNGNDMQQIRSVILMQALYEDGLPAVSDGACPFYSYESIDTLHYYITNGQFGTNKKFLCDTNGRLRYHEAENAESLLNDSAFAWRVLYDKMTGLYYLRNLKSGKYFSHNGTSVSLTDKMPTSDKSIQLMPARINMEIQAGDEVLKLKPYWFARGNRECDPKVIAITSGNIASVSTPTLDFSDKATNQFWLICTAQEAEQIMKANQSEYDAIEVHPVNNSREVESYFTPSGLQISKPRRGVNIVKYTDGTTKKVVY